MNLWACFTKCSLIFKSRCLLILETRCNAGSFLCLCWIMESFCEKNNNNAITYFNLLLLDNIKNAQKIHGLFTNLRSSRPKEMFFSCTHHKSHFCKHNWDKQKNKKCVHLISNQTLISPFHSLYNDEMNPSWCQLKTKQCCRCYAHNLPVKILHIRGISQKV